MDELDRRLMTLADRLAASEPEPRAGLEHRARRIARRRRVQRAGLAGLLVIVAGGLAVVAVRDRSPHHRVQASTTPAAAVPVVDVVTRTSLLHLVGGKITNTVALTPEQLEPSTTLFKRTPSGIVGTVGSGRLSTLVLISPNGSVTRLAGPVSGFAVSFDGKRIAWAEPHIDPDLYIRSTTVHEANFPGLDGEERTDINDQGAVVDYAGSVVLMNLGDGATSRGALWNPATARFADPQTVGLFTGGTSSGLTVATPSDAGCSSLYTVNPGDATTPPSRGDEVHSLDCRGGPPSPDGASTVSVSRTADLQPETIVVYRTSDGSPVGTGPLPAAGPAFIVAWTDADHFAVVMRSPIGPADWQVFVCDRSASCQTAGTVDAQPAYTGQVPLALVVDGPQAHDNGLSTSSTTPSSSPSNAPTSGKRSVGPIRTGATVSQNVRPRISPRQCHQTPAPWHGEGLLRRYRHDAASPCRREITGANGSTSRTLK
jgi:hypothetical protein